jgi:hypothetical protein
LVSNMGTTKPKTGGLASLLRLEKERLSQEAAEQKSSLPPEIPESITLPSSTTLSNDPPGDSHLGDQKPPFTSHSLEDEGNLSESEDEKDFLPAAKSVGQEESERLSLNSTAPPERIESSNASSLNPASQSSQTVKVEIKSLSLTKAAAKRSRSKARSGKQYKFISNNLTPEIQSFVDRWKPFLTETQLNVCIHIYNNSTVLGMEYCFTSTPKLMSVVSKTERQVKTVLDQLITFNFLERGETVVNVPREKRGTYYKLNLDKS